MPVSISRSGGITPDAVAEPGVSALLRLAVACNLGVPLTDVALVAATSNATGASLAFGRDDPVNVLGSGSCNLVPASSPSPATAPGGGLAALPPTVVSLLVTACGAADVAGTLVRLSNATSPVLVAFLAAAAAASGVTASSVSAAAPSVGPPALVAVRAPSVGSSTGNTANGLSAPAVGGITAALVLPLLLVLAAALWVSRRRADRKAQRTLQASASVVDAQQQQLGQGQLGGVNPLHKSRLPQDASGGASAAEGAAATVRPATGIAGVNPMVALGSGVGPRASRTVSSPVALYGSSAASRLRTSVGRGPAAAAGRPPPPGALVLGSPLVRGPRSASSAASSASSSGGGMPLELSEDLVFKPNPLLLRARGASQGQADPRSVPSAAAGGAAPLPRQPQVQLSSAAVAATPPSAPLADLDVFSAELFDFKPNPLHVSRRRVV